MRKVACFFCSKVNSCDTFDFSKFVMFGPEAGKQQNGFFVVLINCLELVFVLCLKDWLLLSVRQDQESH